MHIGTAAEDAEEVLFKEADVAALGASVLVCLAEGFPTNNFPFSQTVPMCFSQVRSAFLKKKFLRKNFVKGHAAFLFIIAISKSFCVSAQINQFLLVSHATSYLRASFFQGDCEYGQKLNTNGIKFSSH